MTNVSRNVSRPFVSRGVSQRVRLCPVTIYGVSRRMRPVFPPHVNGWDTFGRTDAMGEP